MEENIDFIPGVPSDKKGREAYIKTARENMHMCLVCSPGEYDETDVILHQRDSMHVTEYPYGRVHWSNDKVCGAKEMKKLLDLS